MKKGICFYFGVLNDIEERVQMIKAAGFDSIITNADDRFVFQNGKITKQVSLFKKYGLKLSSLHMRYKKEDLTNFFLDNNVGKKLEKNLKDDIKIAARYGFKCVVVHLNGEYSQVGFDRLKRLLNFAEKKNVPIALENLNDDRAFCYIMENFNHPYLKFCYDAGHNNAFHPEMDYLDKFGDRLICVHLHDNDGKSDLHTLNEFGTINWKNLAKKLAKCQDVSLDYELMPQNDHGYDATQLLARCFKQACELEKMIEQERNSKKD